MAKRRAKIDPAVQERLRQMASELRQALYGEAGCPVWGTKFAEIERDGMSVGLELARLLMEQSVDEQAGQMPAEPPAEGEPLQAAGTRKARVETEAGAVQWDEPRGYLKKARRSFFPSAESAGDERR